MKLKNLLLYSVETKMDFLVNSRGNKGKNLKGKKNKKWVINISFPTFNGPVVYIFCMVCILFE